jgi:hypothetical protein
MRSINRLFFDIEVSPNIVTSWRAGYKLDIPYQNIIEERRIICISYKWEGEDEVHHFEWDKNKGDKKMLQQFCKVLEKSDESIGHNGDRFDLKWIRTRCLYHEIFMPSNVLTYDTLKIAKSHFLFNSNTLNYIATFLGLNPKQSTTFSLWTDMLFHSRGSQTYKSARKIMLDYCDHDVILLEQVYNKLKLYADHRINHSVLKGAPKWACPECAGNHVKVKKTLATKAGTIKKQMECKSCKRYYTLPESQYKKYKEFKDLQSI